MRDLSNLFVFEGSSSVSVVAQGFLMAAASSGW